MLLLQLLTACSIVVNLFSAATHPQHYNLQSLYASLLRIDAHQHKSSSSTPIAKPSTVPLASADDWKASAYDTLLQLKITMQSGPWVEPGHPTARNTDLVMAIRLDHYSPNRYDILTTAEKKHIDAIFKKSVVPAIVNFFNQSFKEQELDGLYRAYLLSSGNEGLFSFMLYETNGTTFSQLMRAFTLESATTLPMPDIQGNADAEKIHFISVQFTKEPIDPQWWGSYQYQPFEPTAYSLNLGTIAQGQNTPCSAENFKVCASISRLPLIKLRDFVARASLSLKSSVSTHEQIIARYENNEKPSRDTLLKQYPLDISRYPILLGIPSNRRALTLSFEPGQPLNQLEAILLQAKAILQISGEIDLPDQALSLDGKLSQSLNSSTILDEAFLQQYPIMQSVVGMLTIFSR